jgi:hypothetical protein
VGSNTIRGMDIMCAFILFVRSCVQVVALRWADSLSNESYRLCKISRYWKAAKAQQRVVEPYIHR